MIRSATLGLAAALTLASAASIGLAPVVAAAEAATYSVKSSVGTLLGNPETKAVLNKYIPQIVAKPELKIAIDQPLESIVIYEPSLTPELLAKIDADLAKVAKK